jgi:phage shock protein A
MLSTHLQDVARLQSELDAAASKQADTAAQIASLEAVLDYRRSKKQEETLTAQMAELSGRVEKVGHSDCDT